jgi:hypothetical protein
MIDLLLPFKYSLEYSHKCSKYNKKKRSYPWAWTKGTGENEIVCHNQNTG